MTDIFYCAKSPQGNNGKRCLLEIIHEHSLTPDVFPGHLGLNEVRGNTVHIDIVTAQFNCQRSRQAHQSCIGGTVITMTDSTQARGDRRGDNDYFTVLLSYHALLSQLDAVEAPLQMNIDDLIPLGFCKGMNG